MASSTSGSSSQSTALSGSNQSTVTASGTVTMTVGNFFGLQSWGRVNIGGNIYDIAGPTSMNQGNTWSWSATHTLAHDINGARIAIPTSVSFRVDGTTLHQSSADSGTQGALNYDRKPAAVTGVTAAVNADKSVTVSFGGGASPGGSPALTSTYNLQYSQNGGGFSSPTTGNSPRTITGLAPGSNYVFRVYATNGSNDGAGAAGDSASVFIPSGGKRYDGSSYISTQTAKRYDGSSFVTIVTAKRYDGSNWVNLS